MRLCWRGSLEKPSNPQNPQWFLRAFFFQSVGLEEAPALINPLL